VAGEGGELAYGTQGSDEVKHISHCINEKEGQYRSSWGEPHF